MRRPGTSRHHHERRGARFRHFVLINESRWIGYYRPNGSAKNLAAFEWVTGEPSTFRHWYAANGEPDYDGQCVRLGPSDNWGDNPCSAAFPAICERE